MDYLRYPIGDFVPTLNLSSEQRIGLIEQIPNISITLGELTKRLHHDQLHSTYRPDGWTIQQVVHHMADNDMNAYSRFKRALTEEQPHASSYREDLWAELTDYKEVPIENSIILLQALHRRFYMLLRNLRHTDFQRTLITQALGTITLDIALQRFIWHNQHHIGQIQSLVNRMGW